VSRWAKHSLTVAATLLVTAYAIELGLMFFSPESARIADWAAKKYDLRTRHEMLIDLTAQGKKPVLSLVPKFLLDDPAPGALFPLGGVAGRLTIFCNETGQWALYDSDEHGFNNPRGLYSAPLDVLLVGESFAQGACVPSDKNLGAQLRARFPKTLSLGMDGTGEVTTLASLMEYGPALKPKKVLWMYAQNTLGRANSELKNATLKRYLQEEGFRQGLPDRQPEIDHLWESYLAKKLEGRTPEHQSPGFSLQNFFTLHSLRKYASIIAYVADQVRHKGDEKENLARFKTILEKARSLTSAWGGELVFVYVATPQAGQDARTSDHQQIMALVGELGIKTIDSYEVMFQQDPHAINAYAGKGHYNESGYRLLSELVLKRLSPPDGRP
jgi:hypothetical protein